MTIRKKLTPVYAPDVQSTLDNLVELCDQRVAAIMDDAKRAGLKQHQARLLIGIDRKLAGYHGAIATLCAVNPPVSYEIIEVSTNDHS